MRGGSCSGRGPDFLPSQAAHYMNNKSPPPGMVSWSVFVQQLDSGHAGEARHGDGDLEQLEAGATGHVLLVAVRKLLAQDLEEGDVEEGAGSQGLQDAGRQQLSQAVRLARRHRYADADADRGDEGEEKDEE